MADDEIQNNVTLEERLARLNEIVRNLEEDTIDLEVALELFEEGIQHVRGAQSILNNAELRVKELVGSNEGLEVQQLKDDS